MEVSKTIQGNVAVLDIEGSIVGGELGALDLAVGECLSSGLGIAMANEVCKDIFVATRMDSLVQVHDDRESAVRSLV